MNGPASKQLTSGTVSPGQTVDISVDLKAPNSNGEYRGDWLIRSDAGIVFGVGTSSDVAFYVEIKVGTPSPTPPPVLASNGDIDVDSNEHLNLDTGAIGGSGTDLWFHQVSALQKFFESENGAEFKLIGGSVPSFSDCLSASMGSVQIPIADLSVGDWFCYETNQGNIGRMEIEGITPGIRSNAPVGFYYLGYLDDPSRLEDKAAPKNGAAFISMFGP